MSASSTADPQPTDRSLVDEVHRRIGRNLLMFQAAEESLRLVLPYIHPDGSAKGLEAQRKYTERNVSDRSLGLLIEQLKQAVDGDKQLLASQLEEFVDARNELVHHFHRNPRFNLTAPDGITGALAYLDEQHERAREWASIFRGQALAVLLELARANPKLAAELEPHRERLLAEARQLFDSVPAWIEAPGVDQPP